KAQRIRRQASRRTGGGYALGKNSRRAVQVGDCGAAISSHQTGGSAARLVIGGYLAGPRPWGSGPGAKIRGEPFKSEIAAPQFHHIKPAAALRDLSSAVIALVTDGGLVTEGNPERMESGRPTPFTHTPVEGTDRGA